MTRIENNCDKCELNQTGKTVSQIPLKTVSQIESGKLIQSQSKILDKIELGKPESNIIKNIESNQVGTI